MNDKSESPLESRMLPALCDIAEPHGWKVEQQVQLGPFRVDFVVTSDEHGSAVVECDGQTYHVAEDDWAKRDRWLRRAGLAVYRFGTGEILNSPTRCAASVRVWLMTGRSYRQAKYPRPTFDMAAAIGLWTHNRTKE